MSQLLAEARAKLSEMVDADDCAGYDSRVTLADVHDLIRRIDEVSPPAPTPAR